MTNPPTANRSTAYYLATAAFSVCKTASTYPAGSCQAVTIKVTFYFVE